MEYSVKYFQKQCRLKGLDIMICPFLAFFELDAHLHMAGVRKLIEHRHCFDRMGFSEVLQVALERLGIARDIENVLKTRGERA